MNFSITNSISKTVLSLFVIFCIPLIYNCTEAPTAGTTSDVDNPGVAVLLRDSLTEPLIVTGKAAIYAADQNPLVDSIPFAEWPLENQSAFEIDSGTVELMGLNQSSPLRGFTGKIKKPGKIFNLIVTTSNNQGAMLRSLVYNSEINHLEMAGITLDTTELKLLPLVYQAGEMSVVDNIHKPVHVYLPGTPWHTGVFQNQFVFPSLVQGQHPLMAVTLMNQVFQTNEPLVTSQSHIFTITQQDGTLASIPALPDQPYPFSPVITEMNWAPENEIIRVFNFGNHWTPTWGENDNIYTGYAQDDSTGPAGTPLSLGFARITGSPPDLVVERIPSTDEHYGWARDGKKSTGMLMVDGILYLWVRNADANGDSIEQAGEGKWSELWWSGDLARNWSRAGWMFREFGYCTFINFGQNYQGSRDNYIYTVSHNFPDGYTAADNFILMRAPRASLQDSTAWEYFQSRDDQGNPVWTAEMSARGSVFSNPGKSLRSSISYNAGINRYIWVHTQHPAGSFGIYDAPEPWGPWTTVLSTDNWDVSPGQQAAFPTKWMSRDGLTMYLEYASSFNNMDLRRIDLNVNSRPIKK